MPLSPNPVRVLLIDDDSMSRELLTLLLQAEDYTVDAAESGESALADLRTQRSPPALIVTDMQMPGLCGSALAHELRRAAPAALLIAISASQPLPEAAAPYDAFLLKPFNIGRIAGLLRTHTVTPAPVPEPASNRCMETLLEQPIHAAQAPPIPFATTSVLSEKIYQQLAASMTAPQLREIYTMCLADTRQRIALMRRLTLQSEAARFIREAHAIKGSSGMLGATQLHLIAADLERSGPAANLQSPAQVNSLDELAAACDQLERILGSRI